MKIFQAWHLKLIFGKMAFAIQSEKELGHEAVSGELILEIKLVVGNKLKMY